jgi:hypothetical protein
MYHVLPPRTFGPLPCGSCRRLIHWPLWRRVDFDSYTPLCEPCRDAHDRTFTEENAILQALIIIGVHQGALAVQR